MVMCSGMMKSHTAATDNSALATPAAVPQRNVVTITPKNATA